LRQPEMHREIRALVRAISNDKPIVLEVIRHVPPRDSWWERLSLHRHE